MKALTVNGKFDQATKKRLQKWLKVQEDGIIGKITVKALQKKVRAKVDGEWGKQTTRQLQKYLNQYSKAGLTVDGGFGVKTKTALQKHLNKVFKKQITPTPKPTQTVYDKMCAWAKKIAESKAYGYKPWKSNDQKTKQCPICHNLKGKYKGWNCIGFVFACWKHGGGLKNKCSCSVISDPYWDKILKAKTDAEATKIAQDRIGLKDIKVIRNGGKALSESSLKKGDILGYYDGKTFKHTVLYIGGGKCSDSASVKLGIRYGVALDKKRCKVAIRYTK